MTVEARSPAASLGRPRRTLSRRTLLWLGAVLVLAAAGWAMWRWVNHSPQPWLARWRVQRYLKKQAHSSDFKVEFPFPSKAEMARVPSKLAGPAAPTKGAQTGKDFETLRDEYFALKTSALLIERGIARGAGELKEASAQVEKLSQQIAAAQADAAATNLSLLQSNLAASRERLVALQKKFPSRDDLQSKEAALAPVVSDLWEFQRAWRAESEAAEASGANALGQARARFSQEIRQKLDRAPSYSEMYRLIGQELWVAGHLLGSANPEHRRVAVSLALNASHQALSDAQNGWVAARICEGYIWPNLDLADDTNRRSSFNPENLLSECGDIFRQNNEFQNVVRTYETALARAGTPQRADWASAQLAMAHEQSGDPKRALEYLRQIRDTNDFRWVLRRVPRLEQQAKMN